MKKCSICKMLLSVLDFNKNCTRKDGLSTVCRNCSKEKSRKYYYANKCKHVKVVKTHQYIYAARNKEYIKSIKVNSGCIICFQSDPCCLDFHHLDKDKKEKNIGNMQYFSLKNIDKEIKKCIVLCANCHRKYHAGRFCLLNENHN